MNAHGGVHFDRHDSQLAVSLFASPSHTVTPVTKTGQTHGETYVVCLDCGKQFAYDFKAMRIGKPIDRSPGVGVLPPDMPKPRRTKLGYALLAAVPAAVVLGAALKRKKKSAAPEPAAPEKATRPEG